MTQQQSFWPLAALMFATGIGIPIFAALNGGFAQQLGNPIAATWVSYGIGFVLMTAIVLVTGLPDFGKMTMAKPHLYLGVVFLLFYIISVTFAAPRIGLGNAVFFVLIGQLIAAATIDHFGLFGAIRFEITARRLTGLAVMAFGVYLAKRAG